MKTLNPSSEVSSFCKDFQELMFFSVRRTIRLRRKSQENAFSYKNHKKWFLCRLQNSVFEQCRVHLTTATIIRIENNREYKFSTRKYCTGNIFTSFPALGEQNPVMSRFLKRCCLDINWHLQVLMHILTHFTYIFTDTILFNPAREPGEVVITNK